MAALKFSVHYLDIFQFFLFSDSLKENKKHVVIVLFSMHGPAGPV